MTKTTEISTLAPLDGMDEAALRAEMVRWLRGKPKQQWNWLHIDGGQARKPAFEATGEVTWTWKPDFESKDLPPDTVDVLRAIVRANRECHERASEAAKRAAVTRRARFEFEARKIAERISIGGMKITEPRSHCGLCGKGLADPESLKRGIGSDCWQYVMTLSEALGRERSLKPAEAQSAYL